MTVVVDIHDLIESSLPSLRESEQQAARVVLEDLEYAVSASTTELAKRANVSPTTITRFCRALGFEGLREFKLCAAQNVAVKARFMSEAMKPADSYVDLIRSMCQGLGATLADIIHEIPALALGDAVNLIARARRISIFALDPLAQCVALDAHARFLRLGVDSSVHFSADEQRLVAANGREGAAYLLFGTEPSTGDVAEFSEIFELQRKPSALIAPNSTPMIRFTGIHVPVRTLAASDMFASSALRYRLLLIVDLLCTAHALNLAGSSQPELVDLLNQAPPPIKR